MTDTKNCTIPHGGKQLAVNPNHRQASDFIDLAQHCLLSLRQLEAALTQSLLHPIDRLQTAALIQRLHDTGVASVVGLTKPEDDVYLLSLLEWRQLPSEGGDNHA